ncbi:tyrosine-type recombinase/integrase [Methyloligella solikamskensis]|uniref:Tyrosine-type recombinase/integrase n=1 Tax=Methyloligella solikamskensis TaxID=1177756 RepID=A0ABW3J7L5_9HYPH
MSDIRKRVGSKGTTYQVRYPSTKTKSGYAYATFNTMKEARAFREDAAARQSLEAASQPLSVSEGVQIWLDVCEKEGRGGRSPVTTYTLKTYRYRAEIIKAYDWPKPLNELTAPDVVEFRSWLLKNHSRDQARKVLSYFHSMVLELVNRGQLKHDFAAGVRVTAASRYDEPVQIPTEREIHQLLSAADRLANHRNQQIAKTWERYRPMLYLAVDSGMRPQEYLVLPRENLTDRGVTVDRALDAGGKHISATKTAAGRRFIDLSPDTIDMVKHYADHIAPPNKFDLVFPTANGTWLSSNNWRRRGFQTACVEAGLVEEEEIDGETVAAPKYKPYDLRHFYASMLIANRVNLKRIQRLMGHSDIQTTLNIYGHVIERVEWEEQEQTCLIASMSRKSCGKSVASSP